MTHPGGSLSEFRHQGYAVVGLSSLMLVPLQQLHPEMRSFLAPVGPRYVLCLAHGCGQVQQQIVKILVNYITKLEGTITQCKSSGRSHLSTEKRQQRLADDGEVALADDTDDDASEEEDVVSQRCRRLPDDLVFSLA